MNLWQSFRAKIVFFHSKVARRVFVLFILCALVPLSVLAYYSFSQVTSNLYSQVHRQLHQASRASGMVILGRLLMLETDLNMMGTSFQKGKEDVLAYSVHGLNDRLQARVIGLVLTSGNNRTKNLLGRIPVLPQLTKDEQDSVHSGMTLVLTRPVTENLTSIYMVKALDRVRSSYDLLLGEISPEYLWGGEDLLSPLTDLFVLDQSNNILFSSFPKYFPLDEIKEALRENPSTGRFTWKYGHDSFFASYWTIFMFPHFRANWILVQSQSRTDVLAPVSNFRKVFQLLVLLTFFVVVLLSLSQIRRSLVPIELLRKATRGIAAKNFKSRVTITTNDEFGELGASFNEMAASLERSNMDLTRAYDSTIEGWSRALDYRDKETEGHSQRVMEMTLRIAREMGITEEELVHVWRGALLHDIGKMAIPDSILLKAGPLTEEEGKIMRLHPVYCYELLHPINYLRPALDIPYCHHEKWDGSGYPRGLKGEQIPLSARIFAAVDVWDALRSERPYRPAWSEEKAKEYILALSGIQFDPEVVQAFMRAIAEKKD